MLIFTRPVNLNGKELKDELKSAGLDVEVIIDNADGTICFEASDEKLAGQVVKSHNGTVIAPEPTIEEKLASVGLSLEDLKAALGL